MESPKTTEEKLAEIKKAIPEVVVEDHGNEGSGEIFKLLMAKLPYDCEALGVVHNRIPGTVELGVTIKHDLPEEFQGHGIGSRLLESLIEKGKELGATSIRATVISPKGLKTMMHVLGEGNVVLREPTPMVDEKGKTLRPILSKTPAQILKENLNSIHVDVCADLIKILGREDRS